MKIEQRQWTKAKGWTPALATPSLESAELVLAFGALDALREPGLVAEIRRFYPAAHFLGCSTAGEICGPQVSDDSLVVTALRFEHTSFRAAQVSLAQTPDSFAAGELIAQQLLPPVRNVRTGAEEKLAHVLVLCDGLKVNGGKFVAGMIKHLSAGITVTGGLAGGGSHLGETLVFRDNVPALETIAAVGFYGSRLKVSYGSQGGWDSFGPERLITKSKGNILYELDGRPALDLYKRYLGEHAKGLPATGLFFPLSIRAHPGEPPVVRAFLAVDEKAQSLMFSGDIAEGAYARLMKGNFDRLIEGAAGAARASTPAVGSVAPDLAILISCVGRKLVLKQRIEEEVEAVHEAMGGHPVMTGFYSHGEISPFAPGARCELHNQTMSITTLSEI
jgi:hypothetical protein